MPAPGKDKNMEKHHLSPVPAEGQPMTPDGSVRAANDLFLPEGWESWAVRPAAGPVTLSARPAGAPVAVIAGAPNLDSLLTAIGRWEDRTDAEVDDHIGRLRAQLDATPDWQLWKREFLAERIKWEGRRPGTV